MDIIYRGVLNKGKIRIFLADASQSCKKICDAHYLNGTASDALSRVLSIGAIMGVMQKSGRLTIKVDADGPLKSLVVDADADGNIRGFVSNPYFDQVCKVGDAIGHNGILTVIKDFGLKRPFNSQIELQSGEIGEDFSYYFKESEQVPSIVMVGSNIDGDIFQSGALIIQLMPGYKEEDIMYVEGFAMQAPRIKEILAVEDKKAALEELFPDIEILSTHPIKFKCSCSTGRFIAGIATLPESDLNEMIEENKDIELTCNFCNQKYTLTVEDIKYALDMKKGSIN